MRSLWKFRYEQERRRVAAARKKLNEALIMLDYRPKGDMIRNTTRVLHDAADILDARTKLGKKF